MRGQVAEYVLVFAAVAAIAIIVLAMIFTDGNFVYLLYDAQAVIHAAGNGYDQTLQTFRDGAISAYHCEYNADTKRAKLSIFVEGWNLSNVRSAAVAVLNKLGYTVT